MCHNPKEVSAFDPDVGSSKAYLLFILQRWVVCGCSESTEVIVLVASMVTASEAMRAL